MEFSTTYISTIVMLLALLFKTAGLNIGNEQITTAIEVIAALCAATKILYERFKKGGINIFGGRTNA
jgi:hypothetical protein